MVFFDTCVLLEALDFVKEQNNFLISNITLKEIEEIKTSRKHDEIVKFQARQALRYLFDNEDKYSVIVAESNLEDLIKNYNLPVNNDSYIIFSALKTLEALPQLNNYFMTCDLSCYTLAKSIGLESKLYRGEGIVKYHGYTEVSYTSQEFDDFYSDYLHNNINIENLLVNEYLLLKNEDKVVDIYKWNENNEYEKVGWQGFEGTYFGSTKPQDPYQNCVLDSFNKNKVTLIGGKPGSGKTYLSLSYLFHLYEKGKIDKIVIFCNPVVARNAAKLGFYPGSVRDKLLSTQVGKVLSSKLGSITEVEKLLDDEVLELVPAGDARGYETPPRAGVYILEAQNLDITLMRMLLQRINDDSKVIIDGDREEQTDLAIYSNGNNGMKRLSEVFKGQPFFGQVDLKNIYRSDIARIADLM